MARRVEHLSNPLPTASRSRHLTRSHPLASETTWDFLGSWMLRLTRRVHGSSDDGSLRGALAPAVCGLLLAATRRSTVWRWAALFVLGLTSRSHASCLDAAIARLPSAEVLGRQTFFLPVGEVRSGAQALDAPRCVTVLAAATNPGASVGGVLYSDTGIELATDGASTPHAALRFCGAAGVTLHWTVEVTAPSEVALAVLSGAPLPLPDFGREIGACFSGAPGLRSPEPDLGSPPPAHSADERVELFLTRQHARGYAVERREVVRVAGQRTERPLAFEAGRCYVVAAMPRVGAVDLALLTAEGVEIVADRRRSIDAVLADCPERSVHRVLVIQAHGADDAALVILSQPAQGPPGVHGGALRAWVEMQAEHGPLQVEAWLHLQAGEHAELPVELSGCGVVGAVRANEAAGARVDLQLVDPAGRLLASSQGGEVPVRYCTRGAHHLRVRMRRGAGRVMVVRSLGPGEEAR